MKTIKAIQIIILLIASEVFAATLTIDVPTADVPRLQEAFGSILNTRDAVGGPRPATQVEIETAIKQWLVGSTKDYERRKNMTAYTPPPFSTEPTSTPTPGTLMKSTGAGTYTNVAPTPNPTATPKKKK